MASVNIRSSETMQLLSELEQFVQSCRNGDLQLPAEIRHGLQHVKDVTDNDALLPATFDDLVEQVDRARREFDAKLFFVVAFGPVKAGKSTLVNALAREYVSPVGDNECTRRPALIMQKAEGEPACIERYLPNLLGAVPDNETDEQRKKRQHGQFDKLVDYLRGIASEDELRKEAQLQRQVWDFSQPQLRRALVDDCGVGSEPLLTVVRVPGGKLIRDGVVMLDMPGLDGGQSNWRDNPFHSWVLQRADFLLFVQSSIAALTKDTRDFLEKVRSGAKGAPVHMMHNRIEARHWALEQCFRDDQRNLQETLQNLRKVMQVELPAVSVNLGLAWDCLRQDSNVSGDTAKLETSGFEKFETELTARLDQDRVKYQERQAMTLVKNRLQSAVKDLRNCQQQLQYQNKKRLKLESLLNRIETRVQSTDYSAKQATFIQGLQAQAQAELRTWQEQIANLRTNIFSVLVPNPSFETFSAALGDYGQKSALALRTSGLFDAHGVCGAIVNQSLREAVAKVEKETVDCLDGHLSNLPQLARWCDSAPLPYFNMPAMDNRHFEPQPLERNLLQRILSVFRNTVPKDTIGSAHFTSVQRAFEQNAQARVQNWLNNCSSAYLQYVTQRSAERHEQFQRLRQEILVENTLSADVEQRTSDAIAALQQQLQKLRSVAEKAAASF